jgi:hypothetical protein
LSTTVYDKRERESTSSWDNREAAVNDLAVSFDRGLGSKRGEESEGSKDNGKHLVSKISNFFFSSRSLFIPLLVRQNILLV